MRGFRIMDFGGGRGIWRFGFEVQGCVFGVQGSECTAWGLGPKELRGYYSRWVEIATSKTEKVRGFRIRDLGGGFWGWIWNFAFRV